MKNILITGGAGFIGSALAKKLRSKNKIYIIDLKKKIDSNKNKLKYCKYIEGDIADIKTFKKIKSKIYSVFHLAAKTSTSMGELYPSDCMKTNVQGTNNLIVWAKKNKPKNIIFTSSMAVYGEKADNVREKNICKPISAYGISKYYGELALNKLKLSSIKVVVLRLFNVYGPGQDYNNLKQGMLSIYLSEIFRTGKVKVTGSLNRYRDFVYIDDVVRALTKSVSFNDKTVYNIGSGKKTKVNDVINKIFLCLGSKSKKNRIILKNSHSGDTWGSYANINEILKTGWRPKVGLNQGIINTINNIKKFYK